MGNHHWVVVLQARAVPPPEGAAQREEEEQRPWGTAEAHKYPQMETTGGLCGLLSQSHRSCSLLCLWREHFNSPVYVKGHSHTSSRIKHSSSFKQEKVSSLTFGKRLPLQGSDPSKYELIQKIQSLQKRLIAKTQDLEEHELKLQVTHNHTHSFYTPLWIN